MATITYTAKRNLIYGHTVDTEYSFEIGFSQYEKNRKRKVDQSTSLSGRKIISLHRVDVTVEIQTVPTKDTALLNQFDEFIASVEAGEEFDIDERGTIAVPISPVASKIKGDFKKIRQGRNDCFIFRFEISL